MHSTSLSANETHSDDTPFHSHRIAIRSTGVWVHESLQSMLCGTNEPYESFERIEFTLPCTMKGYSCFRYEGMRVGALYHKQFQSERNLAHASVNLIELCKVVVGVHCIVSRATPRKPAYSHSRSRFASPRGMQTGGSLHSPHDRLSGAFKEKE